MFTGPWRGAVHTLALVHVQYGTMTALVLLQLAGDVASASIASVIFFTRARCLARLTLAARSVLGAIHNAGRAAHVNFSALLAVTRISLVASTRGIAGR
jgi:hypothetical protein